METKFQTSFIPKKPLIVQESVRIHSPTSIVMVIGVLIFLVSLGAAGFTFVAKAYLMKSQEQYKVNLANNEKRFNLPLIEDLKKANMKIDLANQLLKNHIAVSEALSVLAGLTAEKVRFSTFEFSTGSSVDPASQTADQGSTQSSGQIFKIKMKGIADTFNSVAWQSDVFGSSKKYGTNKVLKNPVLSDLTVDAQGDINFNFTADFAVSDISYANALSAALQSEGN